MNEMRPHFPEFSVAEWQEVRSDPPMSKPFLIRGGCADWPAFTRLTFDYLRDYAGHAEVELKRRHAAGERRVMTLREFLDYCETSNESLPFYLTDWRYDRAVPQIREWMDPPQAFRSWFDHVPPAGRPEWSWVYIGPRNSESQLHLDVKMSSAWNAVFSGCKEWLIFPPDHRFSAELRRGQRVPAPLQFEPGEAWKVIQYPGDLIYVPGEWAHSVLNNIPSIAFTENFVNDSNYETVKRAAEASSDEDFLRVLGFLRAIHARSGRRIEPKIAAVP
jgi:hypothetical protein